MRLSRFFELAEMTRSDKAIELNLRNDPGPREVENLGALCNAVLDPLREAVGRAIKVNSGYRSPAVNQAINGAAASQHLTGMAADIQSPGMPVLDLFKRIVALRLPFDQVIYEAASAQKKWVHVSHDPAGNRGEIRIAKFGPNGRPTGYPLVTAEKALALQERAGGLERVGAAPGYVEMDDSPAPERRPRAKKKPGGRPKVKARVKRAAPQKPVARAKARRGTKPKAVKKAPARAKTVRRRAAPGSRRTSQR